MLLFKNCEIYNPDYTGKKEVTVAGNQIIVIEDKIEPAGLPVEIIDCNKAGVVGESQLLVFRNKKNSRNINGIKSAARNLKIDIYLPGEKFSISK